MPIYDYNCLNCGEFRLMRSIAEHSNPAACPACGNASERVITAPFLADMPAATRVAHQRNELSAHVPQVMSKRRLEERYGNTPVGGGHSHHHGGHHDGWVRSPHRTMVGH